jgi:hypothetical protein
MIKSTTSRKLSDFVRHVLLDGKVTVFTRDKSMDDFMAELIRLRTQFQGVGNNLNQAVRKLHTLDKDPVIRIWLILNDPAIKRLFASVEEIKLRINQFAEKW